MTEHFGLKDLLSIILLFGCLKIHVEGIIILWMHLNNLLVVSIFLNTGRVILSPGEAASVCQLGDSLLLTCSTNGTILRWSFTVRNNQGRLQEYPRFISRDGTEQTQESVIIVNSTTFTFIGYLVKEAHLSFPLW